MLIACHQVKSTTNDSIYWSKEREVSLIVNWSKYSFCNLYVLPVPGGPYNIRFNERASLSLNFSDVFNSSISQRTTILPNFLEQYSEFQWRDPQIRISFVYRFNQKKERERKGSGTDGGEDYEG